MKDELVMNTLRTHRLLVTKGKWSNPIFDGIKTFDSRKGFRDISVGDRVTFVEADPKGNHTGRECDATVTLVVHSRDFPSHFKWVGGEFTTFQFELNKELVMDMWKTGPPPRSGQFQRLPSRFWDNFQRQYPGYFEIRGKGKDREIVALKTILHMFSGSIGWGFTTDIRPESGAKIIAPYDNLGIMSNSFDMVAADPSYNKGFNSEWTTHDKDLPKPKRILIEAARVTKPGGIIAILHIIVIPQYKEANVKCIGRHGILCGPNNAVRLLNVFRKMDGTEK